MTTARRLQFTDDKGESRIIPYAEALVIAKRIVTTEMVREAFVGGIAIRADGGRYELLDHPMDTIL